MPRSRLSRLAAISLLLCATVLVLWQRSYRGCDVIVGEHGPGDHFTWTSEFGLMVFELESRQEGAIQPGWSWFDTPLPRRFHHTEGLLGFSAYRASARHYLLLPRTAVWGVTVPHWFLFVCTAALPWLWLKRYRRVVRRRARAAQGLCVRCGYDVRSNVGRCSECGAPIQGAAEGQATATLSAGAYLPKNRLIE